MPMISLQARMKKRSKRLKRKGRVPGFRRPAEHKYRLPEGERKYVDEDTFFMGSTGFGTSACSKRNIDHLMVRSGDGFSCVNKGCCANC